MKCKDCYWCTLNHALSDEYVCCNQKSENYNKIFTKQQIETVECEYAEEEIENLYSRLT